MSQKAWTGREAEKGEMVSSRTRHSQFRSRKGILASGRALHRVGELWFQHWSEQKSEPIAEHQLLEEGVLFGIALPPLKAACQYLGYMWRRRYG